MNMTPNPGAGLSNAPYVIGNYAPVAGEAGVVNVAYPIGDVRRYGATGVAATDASNAFANADTAAVARASGGTVVARGTHRIAVNLTLSGAIIASGGVITPDNGITLTIAGPVTAAAYQWLDLSAGGKVLFAKGSAREIQPEWFGADPTGTNDSTTALQAAIDAAITSNVLKGAVVTVVLSGSYKTSNSLRGFYWNAGVFSFCTFHMEGRQGYISGQQVEIAPTFLDRPALILQAARSTTIKGITLTGAIPTVGPTWLQGLHDTGGAGGTPWYNSGNVGRDSRYSPYCGIVVDPFGNGLPSDGGIPGHAAYYTQNIGSSVVTVDQCTARNFIAAWALGISNGSFQCDSITLSNCIAEFNKVVVAVGQNQTRNVNVLNLHVLYCRAVCDTRNYGAGTGDLPNFIGGLVGGICKWFMIAGSGFGTGTVKQYYMEATWSLGQWLSGYPIVFDDCNINLLPAGNGGNASTHFQSGGPVTFRGGFFGFFNNVFGRQCLNVPSLLVDGCMLTGEPMLLRMATATFKRAGLFWSGGGTAYGIDHEYRELFTSFASNAEAILGATGCVHENLNGGTTDYRRLRWREYENIIQLDAAAVITVTTDAAGVTTATMTSAGTALKAQVGDVIAATANAAFAVEKFVATDAVANPNGLSIGTVSSIVGSVVTLQDVPNGVTTGTYNIFLKRLPRFRPRAVGVSTAGSNVIASVFPSPSMWPVGARIQGTNIPVGTYVTAVSTVGNTITLSQNATGAGTVELYDVRMHAEEATASARPTYEAWFQGDFVRNLAGTKDANNMIPTGWRCTVAGRGDATAPTATFETVYGSTVTPAT